MHVDGILTIEEFLLLQDEGHNFLAGIFFTFSEDFLRLHLLQKQDNPERVAAALA